MSKLSSSRNRARSGSIIVAAIALLLAAACGPRVSREAMSEALSGETIVDAGIAGDGTDVRQASGGRDGSTSAGSGSGASAGVRRSAPQSQSGATADGGVASASGPAGEGSGTPGDGSGGGGAGPGAGEAGSAEPIRLGNIGRYSGPIGASLAPAREAIQVWAKSVNSRGGINGRPVQVFSADGQGDPARNRAIAQDMIENKGVVAFVGMGLGSQIESVVSFLEERRVPVIGGQVTHTVWNASPMLFPQASGGDTMHWSYSAEAAAAGVKKVGVMYCAEAATCEATANAQRDGGKGYARQNGLELVYDAQVSIAQPDYTAECLEARNAGAELIMIAADVNTVERIADSCARQSYRPLYISPNQGATDRFHRNPDLEGFRAGQTVIPWFFTGSPAAQEYHEALERWGQDVERGSTATFTWVAGKLFERAAMPLGQDITTERLLESLWQIRDETLGGLSPPLTFVKDQPAPDPGCWFRAFVENGAWKAEGKSLCRG